MPETTEGERMIPPTSDTGPADRVGTLARPNLDG